MPETIEATELPLVNVLSNAFRFEIPDYQRPYVWTTEQTSELLDDLLYAMGQTEDVNDISPYFLGSIVIIKNADQPQARIVDGQQRITTLTILFCALRELASEAELKSAIHQYVFARGDIFAGIPGHFRLSVRELDREFFQDSVQTESKLAGLVEGTPGKLFDSQRRMCENARYLWESLSKLDENRRKTLMQFLVQRCYLVVVSTSDQNSAYRIFSVMNDRGLDLSPTDILKAEIIGAIEDRKYTKKWEDIEEHLGRDAFRDLFAHIRMISMKSKSRGNLQQEFQENVLKTTEPISFINSVLEPYADAYEIVANASYQSSAGAEKVNLFLRYLNQLDNFDWIPPAMAFLRRNLYDSEATIRFFRDLERLAYGMFITRANINQRINRYAIILGLIEQDKELFGSESPLQLSPEEKSEILHALDGPIYSRLRVRKTLLLRLDSLAADVGASYEHPIISIEHVLPQNPRQGSRWLKSFSDEDERLEWTDRIANLVLLSHRKNSRAQNFDFDRKKQEYFQKGGAVTFALTSQVLSESEWTPKVLERRQGKLVGALKKEWRLG